MTLIQHCSEFKHPFLLCGFYFEIDLYILPMLITINNYRQSALILKYFDTARFVLTFCVFVTFVTCDMTFIFKNFWGIIIITYFLCNDFVLKTFAFVKYLCFYTMILIWNVKFLNQFSFSNFHLFSVVRYDSRFTFIIFSL